MYRVTTACTYSGFTTAHTFLCQVHAELEHRLLAVAYVELASVQLVTPALFPKPRVDGSRTLHPRASYKL